MIITLSPSDDFDAALEWAPPGTTIRLLRGRHTTRGNWAHRGWGFSLHNLTISGEGMGDTVLALENPVMNPGGVVRKDRDVSILWLGANCEVKDLHFDCSLPAFQTYRVGGLRFAGTYTVTTCRITGLRGSREDQIEVFAISSQGDIEDSIVSWVEVDECKPGSYVSGIYLGSTVAPAANCPRSQVRNCSVRLGGGNWFCYSANHATTFFACSGSGAEHFFHNDVGPTVNVLMESCTGEVTETAFNLIGVNDTTRELAARFCTITGAKRGLVLWETKAVMRGGVVLDRCNLPAEYAACCIAPHCSAAFVECSLSADAIVQYRRGTEPPTFFGVNKLKFEVT